MNLTKLTFKQAIRLRSIDNLIRVRKAYETVLARAWKETGTKEMFLVSSAAYLFPAIARRYERVLAIIRGPELESLLFQLAKDEPVKRVPGVWTEYANSSTYQHMNQTDREGYARVGAEIAALPIKDVPYRIRREERGGSEVRFIVEVETDDLGVECLYFRPGVPWTEIVAHCWKRAKQPRVFFWWLPADYEEKHGISYTGTINPVHAPLNTPDSAEEIKKVLTRGVPAAKM